MTWLKKNGKTILTVTQEKIPTKKMKAHSEELESVLAKPEGPAGESPGRFGQYRKK